MFKSAPFSLCKYDIIIKTPEESTSVAKDFSKCA